MRIKPNRITWQNANSLYQLESKDIISVLDRNGVQVKNISPAGSLRRGRKTIGDLDIDILIFSIWKRDCDVMNIVTCFF